MTSSGRSTPNYARAVEIAWAPEVPLKRVSRLNRDLGGSFRHQTCRSFGILDRRIVGPGPTGRGRLPIS